MWNQRNVYQGVPYASGVQKTFSQYASTPHLFVYQPTDVDTDDIESGYGAGSSSGHSTTTPELIYSSSVECNQNRNVIRRVSASSIKNIANSMRNLSVYKDAKDEGIETGFVTERELMRVETFFRGNKTDVCVCKTLANLYTAKSESSLRHSQENLLDSSSTPAWELRFTGIPVLLLNTGATKSRNKRHIQIILAERATGFTLWSDIIDNLSSYTVVDKTFHTMRLSTDHRQMIGFSFDDGKHACNFHKKLLELTANPANISLSMPKANKKLLKGTTPPKPAKFKLPKKSDISQPCFFRHLTNVDIHDQNKLYSLQVHLPSKV
ncbi:uncharacterized protein LOC136038048 [Artemia franciscana]|uniref:WH1 domain-containing protein n=1 Tax=Artemia franciscana TaxID=6661 RepID=A0AA88LCJ0_ARTSF|nr:hypothetical protein QYM36_010827 [Artemia franciscana]KAK2716400.1 hypothetical protein QYM36_010827 [Artemia franciscana]